MFVYPIKIKKGVFALKKKIVFFVLIGVLVAFFVGTSMFFVLQGMSAMNKEQGYFDVYRSQADDYIRSSPEMLKKYGNNICVEFDNSVTYQRNTKQKFFDKFLNVFPSNVPETIEEFSANIKTIKFNVEINGDEYEVIFEKNDNDELAVSKLIPL